MTGFIYVITNDVNGKQYVGKTTDTLEERFKDHCKPYMRAHKAHRPLYQAMDKYGIEHFSIAQLGEYPVEELPQKEQEWIAKLNTYYDGYNGTLGGEGTQVYNYDLFIEDFNAGMNITQIAEKYQCATSTVSKGLKRAGLNTRRGNRTVVQKNAIPVYQYDLEGNFIQRFISYWAAAQSIVIEKQLDNSAIEDIRQNICGAARNTNYRKSAYGYQWNEELKSIGPVQYQTQGTPVQCVETGEIFPNATQAAKWCGLKTQVSILDYLHQHNGRRSAGKHPITGEKLHWKYIES